MYFKYSRTWCDPLDDKVLEYLDLLYGVMDKLQEALTEGEKEKIVKEVETLDPEIFNRLHYLSISHPESRADELVPELEGFDAWLDDYLRELRL